MKHRERIKTIIAGETPDRCGFWLGNPDEDTWPLLHDYFGTGSEEELRQKLDDDIRWICPQFYTDGYQDPSGAELFDASLDRQKHANAPFADCTDPAQIKDYPWPNPEYLNFDTCLKDLANAGDVYRMSGFWTCFYHNLMDLLGMEEYMIKMHTHPEVVQALTDRVCQFYYDANERFFKASKGLVDAFFFGNDFGTQSSLICSPAHFRQFIMPWFKQFTAQGQRHGLQVILHSCGAVFDVIEDLIEAGVDCLHPLQAKAANMDAVTLSNHFKGRITFMGGIDAQDLLTNGTPRQVRQEVRLVKQLLGPNLIISPSHEAILPNVPPANVEAMASEAVSGEKFFSTDTIDSTNVRRRTIKTINAEKADSSQSAPTAQFSK